MKNLVASVVYVGLVCGLMSFQVNSPDLPVSNKPNVIFILADDLGYGDLGFLGQKHIETPNLDLLAARGMLFSNHYAGAPVCAPSRSALLTGLHTGHTPIRGNFEVQPEGQYPMPDTLLTLGKIFQQAGYRTAAFGKWGLGFVGTTGDPSNQGFDHFFGYNCQRYAHRYYPAYLWENQGQVPLLGNDWTTKTTFAPDLIHQKSLEFMEANRHQPFFLFLPLVMPHAELAVPEDEVFQYYRTKFGEEFPHIAPPGGDYGPEMVIPGYQSQPYPRATFAAMVARIDRYVGDIMNKLEALGISENTLLVFTSDNGAHREGGADPDFFNSNGPFRGYKRDVYEGGIHVPLVVSWPSKIPAGSHSTQISAFWDWLPTLTELLVQSTTTEIDGVSFLPTLLGTGTQKQADYLYWEFHESGGRQALLQGEWKLVKYQVKDPSKTKVELFHLTTDPEERTNVALDHPKRLAELEILMQKAHRPNPVFRQLD
uniref:arylsulfatase n=5 Tax=Algoriphagus sp. TaxID=1872435 RepID=UPI004047DF61